MSVQKVTLELENPTGLNQAGKERAGKASEPNFGRLANPHEGTKVGH